MDFAAAFDFSQYKCGTGINADLPDELVKIRLPTVAVNGIDGIRQMSGEIMERIISASNGAYRIVTLVGTDSLGLTMNQTKALHTANCGLSNNGRDLKHFVAAVFYGLRLANQHEVAIAKLNEYWGYVTTCEYEALLIVD